jgi:hypothetical protein
VINLSSVKKKNIFSKKMCKGKKGKTKKILQKNEDKKINLLYIQIFS